MPFSQTHAHGCGHFLIGHRAAVPRFELPIDLLSRLVLFPHIARRGIHIAKAIQDGAPDSMPGVSFHFGVLTGIELVDGIQQPQHSRPRQVINLNVLRKALPHLKGYALHQG